MMGGGMQMNAAEAALLDPYQAGAAPMPVAGGLDAAWGETQGPMGAGGMMMGAGMGAQLGAHLQAGAGPAAMD